MNRIFRSKDVSTLLFSFALLLVLSSVLFFFPQAYGFGIEVDDLDGVANTFAVGDFRGPVFVNPPGFKREKARVYFPNQYESQKSWPLVVLLHGFTGSAVSEDLYFGMRFRTSRRGFILLTPEGLKSPNGTHLPKKNGADVTGKKFWNATDVCCDFGKTGVDDVAYLKNLIEVVAQNYRVDRRRIYLIGHSNGGFMANRLACETGETFAAIASLAGGTFKKFESCRQPVAVNYLQIHAKNDGLVKFGDDHRYSGGMETVRHWLKKNACNSTGRPIGRRALLPLVLGPDVTMRSWSDCASGKEVELWALEDYQGPLYDPHVPLISWGFAEEVLDFLFSKRNKRN